MVIPFVNSLESFSLHYYDDVRRFCIEDLSGIFYRCLEHDEPRAELDWLTAEKVIGSKIHIFDFSKKFLVLSAYEELRKVDEDFRDKNNREILDYSEVEFDDRLQTIKENLESFLTNDKYDNIIKVISNLSLDNRRDYQKKFLGRDIWDQCYQPFRRMIQDLEFLGYPDYKKVKFG